MLSLSVFFPSIFVFFRPLLFSVLTTQPLFLPFLFLPVSASQWLPRCDPSAHASLAFPRSSQPGFPCLLSRFFVLGFLFVSFHPTRLRSHSCSTGASLLFRILSSASLPGFSACLPLPFGRIDLLLTTQPSVLSFPLFPISPDGGSLGARPFLSSLSLSSDLRPVSKPSSRFRYSASCDFLSPLAVSCHRHYTAAGLLFPARPPP